MSKSIIEKLGMVTPEELKIVGDVCKVYELAGLPRPHVGNDKFFEQGEQLKKILDERNEMLEALIEEVLFQEENVLEDIDEAYQKMVTIIEKACHPLKWEEIKGLLDE